MEVEKKCRICGESTPSPRFTYCGPRCKRRGRLERDRDRQRRCRKRLKIAYRAVGLSVRGFNVVRLQRATPHEFEQMANMIFRLERNKDDLDEWRRNVTKVSVSKNRFCGQTGPACWLHYSIETGRLKELDPLDVQVFEAGQTKGEEWE